jgi:hypothetical protein
MNLTTVYTYVFIAVNILPATGRYHKYYLKRKLRHTVHTRLLRQMTGQREQPRVQQQQRQPQNNQRTFTGRVRRRVTFTRVTVA